MDDVTWDPPGPGPWMQDKAHNPLSQTLMLQQLYPQGFNRGFGEAFAAYGVLLDRLAMAHVHGFPYAQLQPFDMPGPEGPKDPEWIGAEIGRRTQVAAQAMHERVWREAMRRWDEEYKPASDALQRRLGSVDLAALDDAALLDHVRTCIDHAAAMAFQHHRFNTHALVPVGDFLLHAAGWVHRPPHTLFGVLDGYSPVSHVAPPEMSAALDALRADHDALALLHGDTSPADVVAALRARLPEVDEYVASVHYRVLEGFDLPNPTIGERPECIVGRLRAALDADPDESRRRADAFAAELRAQVPAEHQAAFDEMLADARLVYRLRDERGLYSDIPAVGLLRLALLEVGRRLERQGRVKLADDLLDASPAEVDALIAGADSPTAHELHRRAVDRMNLTLAGSPRYLGEPPPPPPPLDMLPPPLARVMGAVGFLIDGVLGQLEAPEGDSGTVVGIAGAAGVYEGPVRLVRSIDDLFDLEVGDVLVAPTTGEAFNSMLHLVGAIVTDHGSFASHAAIVSREVGIPAVVGTCDATSRLRTGDRVRVDGAAGTVTIL